MPGLHNGVNPQLPHPEQGAGMTHPIIISVAAVSQSIGNSAQSCRSLVGPGGPALIPHSTAPRR